MAKEAGDVTGREWFLFLISNERSRMWISVTMTTAGEILPLRKLCDELAAVKGIDFNYFF